MRLPKPLLLCMALCCIFAILGTVWYWCTWPDRTLAQFQAAVATGDWDTAGRLLRTSSTVTPQHAAQYMECLSLHEKRRRTLSDLALGIRRLQGDLHSDILFAQRGHVVLTRGVSCMQCHMGSMAEAPSASR